MDQEIDDLHKLVLEEYIDDCYDDLRKLLREFGVNISIKNIPRQDIPKVYSDLCQAYKLITNVIDKYKGD